MRRSHSSSFNPYTTEDVSGILLIQSKASDVHSEHGDCLDAGVVFTTANKRGVYDDQRPLLVMITMGKDRARRRALQRKKTRSESCNNASTHKSGAMDNGAKTSPTEAPWDEPTIEEAKEGEQTILEPVVEIEFRTRGFYRTNR